MISNILEINNLTISLSIIILILLFMLMKRLNIIVNRTTHNKPIYNKDKFNNISSNDSNTKSNEKNNISRYNEITYGMNPECVKSNVASNAKFCPNAHPNIPCSLVEDCNTSSTNPHLTDEMKRDIYMYVYLTGLLESADIYNSEKDDYWYNNKINTTTTNSN